MTTDLESPTPPDLYNDPEQGLRAAIANLRLQERQPRSPPRWIASEAHLRSGGWR